MLALADDHGCELIGGDTTKGPLTLSITVFGDVPRVRRCGATRRPGDDIWISGTLGDARLALGDCRGEWLLPEPDFTLIRPRMEMPTPRVALGLALRGVAHAALDISDGLIGDLGHILERSSVGALSMSMPCRARRFLAPSRKNASAPCWPVATITNSVSRRRWAPAKPSPVSRAGFTCRSRMSDPSHRRRACAWWIAKAIPTCSRAPRSIISPRPDTRHATHVMIPHARGRNI
jgi:hypothetical protein